VNETVTRADKSQVGTVNRFSECATGNATIIAGLAGSNYSYVDASNYNHTLNLLRAVEDDFNCAGYCTDVVPRYRTFSWV
jgi:hypothetical protein